MSGTETTSLILIRHAPSDAGGRLAGRSDPAARLPGTEALTRARAALAALGAAEARLVTSPARRCRETVAALLPGREAALDPRLWEQDFGAWEGLLPEELPDLGPLGRAEIAAHRAPGGESFLDLWARVTPALEGLTQGGMVVVVAHAGTIRAALGLALGEAPAGLGFEIAPLSATHLRAQLGGVWSIGFTNRALA